MDIHKLRAATPPDPAPIKPDETVHSETSTRPRADARTSPIMASEGLTWCLAQYETRHGPLPGSGRNNWLAALAFFCNERGVPLADLDAHAVATYAASDFTEREIRQTVGGIYTREAAAHGSKPYTDPEPGGNKADFAVYFGQKENGPPAELPPTFPAAVYDALPSYLTRCCDPFDGHEKAVMLLGTLAVLSGCFPAVGGIYYRKRHGLNLFVFLIAPAASGKGTLAWAQRLARPWHKRLVAESAAAQAEYEAEQAAHKAAGKGKGQPGTPPQAGSPPPRRMLFLPGNTTAAAMLGHLAENDGRGIICETEADTLSGALGADFGNFSDVLRKAFHHEPVSVLRKTDRQHLDLERPALSIALTGTPGQLLRLMPTAEDGLVSRFVFYTFAQAPAWQDVSPSAGQPLDGHFTPLADELTRMIEATPAPDTEAGCYPVEIVLDPADWHRLNAAGEAGLTEAVNDTAGGAGASTAFRLGLIAWRIVGLLTVLRCFEHGVAPAGRLLADPTDVGTALAIMDTARAHALVVLASLPTPSGAGGGRWGKRAADEARVRELHAQGLGLAQIVARTGLPKTTVHRYLNHT